MEVVKETGDYKIFKKRSGRYGVQDSNGQWVNGIEKVKILVAEGLVDTVVPTVEAPVVVAQVEEPAAEENAAEDAEPAAEAESEKEAS